jgi:hypothetical protein
MLPDTSHQQRVIEDIKANAGVMSVDKLKEVLAEARRQRPMGFDEVSLAFAKRYSGDQVPILRDALKRAYKNSWQHMPVDPVGWLQFFARQDAGIYNEPAKRTLVDASEDLQAYYNEQTEIAGLDEVMLSIERRAKTGLKSAVVVVGWRAIPGEGGELTLHVYWPHDVLTVSHPSMPDDPRGLVVCAIRQARLDSGVKSDLWWVWSRDVEETATGVEFGGWMQRRVSEDGTIATPTMTYDGEILPVGILRLDSGSGGLWPEPHRDVIANVDALNVARSNRQHLVNMQAHSVLVVNSKTKEEADIVVAPDVPLIFQEEGASAQYLVAGADHEAVLESAARDLEEIGVSRGNNPDAYAVTPGEAQSGVSRLIANAPHDQLVAESRPIFKRFEERTLGPIILDVMRAFSPVDVPVGMRVSVEMSRGKIYEDDTVKTERVLSLLAAGIIDEPRALVMLGMADTREDALVMLEEMRGAGVEALPGVLAGSPFTSTRETTVGAAEE